MAPAAHLWAIGYDNIGRAAEVRDEVNRLGAEHCLILMDTAVVIRYANGSVTLDGEPFFVTANVREGGFAGLLAGIALAAPLQTGAAVGAIPPLATQEVMR